jgi:MEMO1 family protein
VLPLIKAPRVILVGVFHRYRRLGIRDRLVFDPYRAWRTPDGPVPVSGLREDLLSRLPAGDFIQDAASHDSEHSLEAEVFWLRHINPDLEIVPIIVPAASFERLGEMAVHLGDALADICRQKDWLLGRDVALVISSDGVHYGADFKYTPFGDGGVEAYTRAVAQDRNLLLGPLGGSVTRETVRGLLSTFVDPDNPDQYRLTWCGRFALPFGLLFLNRAAGALRQGVPTGRPVAYATSVGAPELPLREIGLNETAPANLYHFVGLPAAAFEVLR